MTRKRSMGFLSIAVLVAVALAAPLSVRGEPKCSRPHHGGHGGPSPRHGKIAGSWILIVDMPPGLYPMLFTETLTPLDPTGKCLSYLGWTPNPMMAPDEVAGHAIGTFVRSGPDMYDFTFIAHTAKEPPGGNRGEITGFWLFSGTAWLSDENTLRKEGTVAIFLPEQDDDPHDGFPDEGEEPIVCMPWIDVSKRVQVMPPYEPTPPPPGP